jgi:hypothetical protein
MVQIASFKRLYWRKVPLFEKEGLGEIFVISDCFSSFDQNLPRSPFYKGGSELALLRRFTNAGFREQSFKAGRDFRKISV